MEKYNINWLIKESTNKNLDFIYFWGHTDRKNQGIGKFCFSQWYESEFSFNDVLYKTAEHWMMAQKALLFNDQISFNRAINAASAKDAKTIGRGVKNYDEKIWKENRTEIVVQGNIHKFVQNPMLGDFLIKTGTKILVEASPYDSIWGIGLSADDIKARDVNTWKGLNLLGFALMEVRDFLNSDTKYKL